MTMAIFQLSDVAELITKGTTPPKSMGGFSDVGVNYIKSESLSYSGAVDTSNLVKVSPEVHQKLKRSQLKEHDILYSIAGANLGKCGIVPPEILPANTNQAVAIIRLDQTKADARFVSFFLRNPRFVRSVLAGVAQSAQPNVNLADIGRYELPALKLPQQKAIGEALGSLDDKIELNRRMNETLEEMARALFRDWFVDFGPTRRKAAGETDPAAILGGLLPDPEKAAPLAALFPDSFGNNGLPEGWEERKIADDFDVEMGQSPPGSTYNEEGEGLPFFQGRRNFQFRFPEKRVFCSAPTRIAQSDWTLISVRAPVGDINRAWEKCCIGRGVGAMMHKKGWASFTYYVGLHLQTELASYDKDGTVFGSINQKQLKGLSLIGTNSSAAKAFDDLIAPMDAMIRNNTVENQTLAATRDLLLPKLMSGDLRLTGAEGVQ